MFEAVIAQLQKVLTKELGYGIQERVNSKSKKNEIVIQITKGSTQEVVNEKNTLMEVFAKYLPQQEDVVDKNHRQLENVKYIIIKEPILFFNAQSLYCLLQDLGRAVVQQLNGNLKSAVIPETDEKSSGKALSNDCTPENFAMATKNIHALLGVFENKLGCSITDSYLPVPKIKISYQNMDANSYILPVLNTVLSDNGVDVGITLEETLTENELIILPFSYSLDSTPEAEREKHRVENAYGESWPQKTFYHLVSNEQQWEKFVQDFTNKQKKVQTRSREVTNMIIAGSAGIDRLFALAFGGVNPEQVALEDKTAGQEVPQSKTPQQAVPENKTATTHRELNREQDTGCSIM